MPFDAVGVLLFKVYRIVAPLVAVANVMFCGAVKVPLGKEKVGVATAPFTVIVLLVDELHPFAVTV